MFLLNSHDFYESTEWSAEQRVDVFVQRRLRGQGRKGNGSPTHHPPLPHLQTQKCLHEQRQPRGFCYKRQVSFWELCHLFSNSSVIYLFILLFF